MIDQIRASGSSYPRWSKPNTGLRGSVGGKGILALGFDGVMVERR
ncbi:hypothetical protein LCGC14_1181830 [marine sediment metagenome]|uniref:Uncharacterized protein n=1 Tax=marine sediment metagenome TaxID=412755 RepID=A0A0F9M9N2_9ZZZZ